MHNDDVMLDIVDEVSVLLVWRHFCHGANCLLKQIMH
ncbi:Uncharacterised protein [Zhongshania aliphaticivorans]|uniref:Uncharacterized protein n=1 Tax=Zhongshania aliphaticivorans TaxID=1470434 RepID=A0A5S9NUT3_9GAMM|nr:Uncharacterised protein [Zhongshania aliphaticivorans]CAA0094461.1 Uncharacterised protein [Zhongshania aliphaticivorans]